MPRFGIAALTASALLISSSLGCVTQGKYDKAIAQRDQAITRAARLTRQKENLTRDLESKERELAEVRAAGIRLESALETEVASGQVEIRNIVDGVKLGVAEELLFASGSTALTQAGRKVLSRIARELEGGNQIISIEGHSDSYMIGKSLEAIYPSNWELAAARAAKVVRRLSAEGIDPIRLRVVSRGPFDPIASNDTAKGRQRNRRTEIVLRTLPR